jgi:hypothetical protein
VACLGVIERKEAAKNWDRDRPDTWSHIYLDGSTITNHHTAEQFEICRNEFIRQAELRLLQLRDAEGKRQGSIPVEGGDIEKLRAHLLKRIRRKATLLRDDRYVEEQFNAEQRRILYILLGDLEESIPWRFPWWEGMEAVHRHLVETTNHSR